MALENKRLPLPWGWKLATGAGCQATGQVDGCGKGGCGKASASIVTRVGCPQGTGQLLNGKRPQAKDLRKMQVLLVLLKAQLVSAHCIHIDKGWEPAQITALAGLQHAKLN